MWVCVFEGCKTTSTYLLPHAEQAWWVAVLGDLWKMAYASFTKLQPAMWSRGIGNYGFMNGIAQIKAPITHANMNEAMLTLYFTNSVTLFRYTITEYVSACNHMCLNCTVEYRVQVWFWYLQCILYYNILHVDTIHSKKWIKVLPQLLVRTRWRFIYLSNNAMLLDKMPREHLWRVSSQHY